MLSKQNTELSHTNKTQPKVNSEPQHSQQT